MPGPAAPSNRRADTPIASAAPATLSVQASGALRRRPGRARLRVHTGPDAGKVVDVVGRKLSGGRSKLCTLTLSEESVSSVHFEIVLEDQGVLLRDLDSTNGTTVGGVRVREAWLEPGVRFHAGRCVIEFVTADDIQVAISEHDSFEGLMGWSAEMKEMFAILEAIAAEEIDVLMRGETGTGKELAARGLHQRSPRKGGPFIVLDCTSLPRDLAEGLVLGYRKGTFTGALADHAGSFEDAHGGTLFIDEIGELPFELQPKLLRVLDRREVQRLGESTPRLVDVRVVCATHRDLWRMVGDGCFREDLYFRIAEVVVELPPLRRRDADVVLLAERFLEEHARARGVTLVLDASAKAALRSHDWPGNVRELRKAIKRAAIFASNSTISREHLRLRDDQRYESTPSDWFDVPYRKAQEEFGRSYFEHLLDVAHGNLSEVARRAGYSRQGLHDLLRKLRIRSG